MADLKALYDEGYKTSHEMGLQNVFDAGVSSGKAQMVLPEYTTLPETSSVVQAVSDDAGNGNPPPPPHVVFVEADAGNGNPPPPPHDAVISTVETDSGNGEPPKP